MSAAALKTYHLWLKQQGVRFEGVQLKRSNNGGLGVFSTRAIDEGSILIAVPETAVLSLRTLRTDATDMLLEHDVPAGVVHKLVIAAERKQGSASRFHTYLETLSTAEDMPVLWEPSELAWLAGTGLDDAARERRSRLDQEYAEAHAVLLGPARKEPGAQSLTVVSLPEYLAAASLTSSRAMYVDERHGYALVPGADALNHKVAVADWGEDGGKGHDEMVTRDASVRAAAAAEGMDLSLDVVVYDAAGHVMGHDSSDEEEEQAEAQSDDDGSGPVRHLLVAAERPLPPKHEIFFSYGELGNRKLLSLAGFILPANPLDTVTLPWAALRAAFQQVGASPAARERTLRRVSAWRAHLDGAYEFDVSATPPKSLRIVLWLLTASEDDLREGMEDKGGKVASRAVAKFLSQPLARQLSAPAIKLLRTAIEAHLTAYPSHDAKPKAETSPPGGHKAKRRRIAQNQGASAASGSADPGSSHGPRVDDGDVLRASRRARAEALVRGERALWTKALGKLR